MGGFDFRHLRHWVPHPLRHSQRHQYDIIDDIDIQRLQPHAASGRRSPRRLHGIAITLAFDIDYRPRHRVGYINVDIFLLMQPNLA